MTTNFKLSDGNQDAKHKSHILISTRLISPPAKLPTTPALRAEETIAGRIASLSGLSRHLLFFLVPSDVLELLALDFSELNGNASELSAT